MKNIKAFPTISASHDSALCFIFGLVVGALVFVSLWGTAPLNPFNIEWILNNPYGSDFCFTEIGVLQFLKSEWTFPPGLTNGLLYPTSTSVVFFDAIPLVAIIAKVIRFFYPHDFQYFGIWGFVCMALQGGISSLIIRKYCANSIISAISSAFFCLSPFLLGKMFGHASMSGQWLILLPILFIWYRDTKFVANHEIVLWSAITAVSVGILAYFTPMVFLLMVVYYAVGAQSSGIVNNLKRFALSFISSVACCLFVLWFIGGFLPGNDVSILDYGIAPYNLNGLFNPGWSSKIIQAFPHGKGSSEGHAWLGLGVIIGGLYLAINALLVSEQNIIASAKLYSPYVIACSILIAFAATNKVMFGDYLVFSYILPQKILALFSIFRTSGRFIWPVWYLIVIFIIGNISAMPTRAWRKGTLIAILLCVQIFDATRFYKEGGLSHTSFPEAVPPPLSSILWEKLEQLSIKHVVFIPYSGRLPHNAWSYIAAQAIRQGATTNVFWLGRTPMRTIQNNIEQKIVELKSGSLSDGDLFVINYIPILTAVNFSSDIRAYLVDDQVVLGKRGLEKIDDSVKSINVKRSTLAEYLKHLRLLDYNFMIILSGREKDLPVALDDATRQELHNLNIGSALDHASNINYVSVIGPNRSVLFENQDGRPITYSKLSSAIFPIPIEVSVDLNFGAFPRVLVNGIDCSHSHVGLNICVYDIKLKKIVEVGAFDLYTMGNGVYLQM
ncbi:MAG: DUF6311 domain-containing protein [Methylobacter sp.]|nr:DUF6311 domain-containing protein [Methylobacter sp.]